VLMVVLEKDRRGLGISLAGHKDRNRMAVFICGLNPKGVAHKNGGLLIGDEILEVGISYLLPSHFYDLPFTTCGSPHDSSRRLLRQLFNFRFTSCLICLCNRV